VHSEGKSKSEKKNEGPRGCASLDLGDRMAMTFEVKVAPAPQKTNDLVARNFVVEHTPK